MRLGTYGVGTYGVGTYGVGTYGVGTYVVGTYGVGHKCGWAQVSDHLQEHIYNMRFQHDISSSAQPAQTFFCLRFVLANIYKMQAIIFTVLILV